MKSLIELAVNGDMILFENTFSDKEVSAISALAQEMEQEKPWPHDDSVPWPHGADTQQIKGLFVLKANQKLGLVLNEVKISEVVRIKL